jgi:hypothetical protein
MFYFLVTLISLGAFFFIGTIIPMQAVKKDGTLLEHYNNSKELVGDIKNGTLNDDQISLNDFKNSGAYKNADKNMHDCIKLATKIGHNLRDDEIVHCFEDANYFKQKYSIGNNKTNNTNIKDADSINNATSADANATSSRYDANATSSRYDANATSSRYDANATSADANATSADANATSADANATSSRYDANATRISITGIINRPYFKIS